LLNQAEKINYGGKENYKCIFKTSKANYLRLEATEIQTFIRVNMSMKIVFELNKEITKEVDLNEAVLAVIWQKDYDEKLDLNEFKTTESNNYKKIIVLPFSLIKFQKPTIIKPVEPRLPSIGFCVHYIYSFPPH
jgi:fatty acid-binding protein DegV